MCPPNNDFCSNETIGVIYDSSLPGLYNVPVPSELPPNSTCILTINASCGFPTFGNPNKTANFNITVISGDVTNVPTKTGTCQAEMYSVAVIAGDNRDKKSTKEKIPRRSDSSSSNST